MIIAHKYLLSSETRETPLKQRGRQHDLPYVFFFLFSSLCFPARQAEATARQNGTSVSSSSFFPMPPCRVPRRAAAGFLLPCVGLRLVLSSFPPAILVPVPGVVNISYGLLLKAACFSIA